MNLDVFSTAELEELLGEVRKAIRSRQRTRYGPAEREAALAAYRAHGSIEKAAKACGVSQSWLHKVAREAGAIKKATPVYSARLVREAERLYVQERLSCREVAQRLAAVQSPPPTQGWVFEHMKRKGLLRSKGETNRIWMSRRRGVDYERDLPEKARALREERGWSPRRIGKELGISTGTARRYIGADAACSPREAQILLKWHSDGPDVGIRRRKRIRAGLLRAEGRTYREIAQVTGLSKATIGTYLRQDGLTRPPQKRSSRKGRKLR